MACPDSLPGKSGIIVSLQRGGDVATTDDVAEVVRLLTEDLAPRPE